MRLTGIALCEYGKVVSEYGKHMHICGNGELARVAHGVRDVAASGEAPSASNHTLDRCSTLDSGSGKGARIKVSRGSSPNTRR